MDQTTNDATLLAVLKSSAALKTGHFLLASGKHSDRYIEKFDVLRQPKATSAVCGRIADRYRGLDIDVVVGPTTGGVILAFETARQLGVKAAYAERADDAAGGRAFRRGTAFDAGARVLIVDDILTTGASIRETLAALEAHPVVVAGIAVLVDRSQGGVDFGIPISALARLEIPAWEADVCPLCASGVALTKPGTTPTPAGPPDG